MLLPLFIIISRLLNQSINQSLNQANNQSSNQSINQSIHQVYIHGQTPQMFKFKFFINLEHNSSSVYNMACDVSEHNSSSLYNMACDVCEHNSSSVYNMACDVYHYFSSIYNFVFLNQSNKQSNIQSINNKYINQSTN